mmetsp:Transcript_53080/g.119623  ORF Transcript_53080/g.119623 Transcript_53080/m.119623 type:complete len:261 (+) Transcript_53080:1515-2297(+)
MPKSSSIVKESFFLPPRAEPVGYRVVRFFSHSPLRDTTCTAYSCDVTSVKKIFFTRKEVLELAATRAAPRAAASSPLRCCPSGSFLSLLPKYSERSDWILGTRQAPPTTSTCVMSLRVRFALCKAVSIGLVSLPSMSLHMPSKASRLMVAWKSVSSYRDSTMKGAPLLELRMALVFWACERSFRRARGFFTTPSASLGNLAWNSLSMTSAILMSMRCPPMPVSMAEPITLTTGAILPATIPADRLSNLAMVTSAFLEPRL